MPSLGYCSNHKTTSAFQMAMTLRVIGERVSCSERVESPTYCTRCCYTFTARTCLRSTRLKWLQTLSLPMSQLSC